MSYDECMEYAMFSEEGFVCTTHIKNKEESLNKHLEIKYVHVLGNVWDIYDKGQFQKTTNEVDIPKHLVLIKRII